MGIANAVTKRALMEMEDVVIIGAGPGGLFTACELARHGVRARLFEQQAEPHHQARGTAIQPATLELLSRAGVIDEFVRWGAPMYTVRMCNPDFGVISGATLAGIDSAYEWQCCIPQWRTELLLTTHLERLGGEVERASRVSAISHFDDHVQLTVERGGSREIVHTRYLIGAGGAHSITRAAMNESLVGETYAGHYVVADARIAHPLRPDEATIVVGPKGFVLLAPLPDERRLIFVDVTGHGVNPDEMPDLEALAALLNKRIGVDVGVHDLTWASHFRMHKRMAPTLTDGHCFLVGDAGHLSSPIGGEGLNAALHDAADIAWKLALVLHGHGRNVLLDSYAIERGMADQHAVATSDLAHAGVMAAQADLAGGRTVTVPPADAERDRQVMRSRSMLDVSYHGSPLVAEGATGERYPDRCRLAGTCHHLVCFGARPDAIDAFARRWDGLVEIVDGTAAGLDPARAGIDGSGVVLVRPDGYIGFRAAPTDNSTVEAAGAHLERYLV